MDDSNSDWDSLPHEEQGKKNLRIHIKESNMKIVFGYPDLSTVLTHISISCLSLPFFVDNVVKMKNEPLKNSETEEERPPFDFRQVST